MRAILDVVFLALNLYEYVIIAAAVHVVADRLQRGQHPQRLRPLDLEHADRVDGAAAVAASAAFCPTWAASIFRRSSFTRDRADRAVHRSLRLPLRVLGTDARSERVASLQDRAGRFFEDFRVGETLRARDAAHADTPATPRSIRRSTARASRCRAPTRSRRRLGYPRAPIDDLLAFHIVFGKTVARHLAQRHRQSRLRRGAVSQGRSIPATR